MFEDLKGKGILVTGAAGQLGLELSRLLSDLGSKVIGVDVAEPTENCFHEFFKLDLTNEWSVDDLFMSKVFQEIAIHGLVNNAGYSVFSHFEERTRLEFFRTLEVNLWAPFVLLRAFSALPFLSVGKSDQVTWRSIVNVSSIYGQISPDFSVYDRGDRRNSEVYGASKAGLNQLTRYFSVALSENNIRVNSVVPGGIYNDKNPQSAGFVSRYSSRVPMGRMANVKEVAHPILFLLSDYSNYVNGSTLVVDGGLSAL